MRLHAVLPNETPQAGPDRIVDLAVLAEELGFAGVWLPDHLLPPAPYGPVYGGVYEPLVTLAHISARTSRIRMGTSVLVLPLRDPFTVAKQAATLDRLSGGRFVLGVGIGWDRAEFGAVGADYADRAGRTEEAIRLIRHLHDRGGGPFEGERFGFGTGVFEPRPGGGRVPIMVGGMSDAALRRAARHADMWQSVDTTPERFAEPAARFRDAAGRPVEAGARTGWRDDLAAELPAWERAGADHLAVHFGDAAEAPARMEALRRAFLSR
ncbi:TIGR03619 family F420-dependent LLM class oxidoreductase [Actinomadura viridis]|uniref:TIGR03619 family F420-dependent LLM class oxidoreductase n=1 Tax=Actinomadura viridis TaxID=58110 RepID=UPI0036A511AE